MCRSSAGRIRLKNKRRIQNLFVKQRVINRITKPMQYKKNLTHQLIVALEAIYQTALTAAKRAHSTATDKANIAENKYDTLGLEAAYLAEGHANRAAECKVDIDTVKNLVVKDYAIDDAIALGTLVGLLDQDAKPLLLFLAPVSGGIKFEFESRSILVITQSSPLGKQLLGKYVDDEFEIGIAQHKKRYKITDIA